MSAEVRNETEFDFDLIEFADLVQFVLANQRVNSESQVSIFLVDKSHIQKLNKKHMGENRPTDVLSFPMDELKPGREIETPAGILGDIVLCPEIAQINADEMKHSLEDEVLLLIVHSVLHLLGYDHADPNDEAQMFALQRQLLLEFLASK